MTSKAYLKPNKKQQDGNFGYTQVNGHRLGYNLCKFYCHDHEEVKR